MFWHNKSFFTKKKEQGRDTSILICCYHKAGTVLFSRVFTSICAEFGWVFVRVFENCDRLPDSVDVILFNQSLIDLDTITLPYTGVHLIRDPRDVIVSGYLYHKRTNEEWCTNTNFDLSEPIKYPRVPYSQQHRSEAWKRQYILSLGGRSYQQNLLDLDEDNGLLFELYHYGSWTINSMQEWNYTNPNIEEVKFEQLLSDYDNVFGKLFEKFKFSKAQISRALDLAAKEDMNRMSHSEITQNQHISSRKTSKWRSYFKDIHIEAFRQEFGDVLLQLGYDDF